MKLLSLQLDHFSSHISTTVEFAKPITLIVGALNSGKSSIAQAIEFALTGTVERYRGARSPFQDLIHDQNRNGDSRFVVSVKTETGTIKRGKSITGPGFVSWDGQTENAEAMAYGAWRTTRNILSALLATGDFFELEEKAQKELILRLVGAEVSRQAIEEEFKKKHGNLDALQLIRAREIDSIQAIDNAHKQAFEGRTIVNRELRELKPPVPPDGKQPPVQEINAKILELEGQFAQANAEVGRLEERARTGGSGARQALEDRIKELRAFLAAPVADIEPTKLAMTRAQEQEAAARHRIATLQTQLVEARALQLVHEQNTKTLSRFNGMCVAGPHECPATTEQMVKAKDLEQQATVKAGAEVKRIEALIQAVQKEDHRSEIARLQGELANYEMEGRERMTKRKSLDTLAKQLETATGASPVNPEELIAARTKSSELSSRLAAGRKKLEGAQAWIHQNKQVQEVATRRAALERQSQHLKALVEFFGPSGIKVPLIESKIKAFEELVNSGLKKFGFDFQFRAEPWEILAKGRPVDRLSRSERYRLGVALQVAIARHTGVNYLICDNAEFLTPDARKAMIGLLVESGVQVMVIMTSINKTEEEFLKAPPKGPFDVIWVRNVNGVSEIHRV